VLIGLSGSTSGISYQLKNGTLPVGSPVIGTGAAISFGMQTAAGTTYIVVATNTTTGCTNAMTGSTSVTINPVVVPAVTITSTYGDTVCEGTMTTFTPVAVNGGTSPAYQWSVNGSPASVSSTYSYSPANGDVVAVTLTSSATCAIPATATDNTTMTVLPKLMPSVNVAALPGTIVCQGSVVTFYATPTNGGTAPAYLWVRNGLHVSTSPTYAYVPVNGDVIHCELSSSYVCRLMNVVSSPTITADQQVAIEITDMLGQSVYRANVLARNGELDERIQLSNTLANGMYVLTLRSDAERKVFHVVIEQ